jgi:hypothetical protein
VMRNQLVSKHIDLCSGCLLYVVAIYLALLAVGSHIVLLPEERESRINQQLVFYFNFICSIDVFALTIMTATSP